MTQLPLRGITVLDFTWQIAGPIATKTLMELGARVIKVESSAKLDGMRVLGPHPADYEDINHSGGVHVVNSCKESIGIDMKTPGGREAITRLLPNVDVVINNYAPGVLERWGFGGKDVLRLNPKLVYISMPAVGNTGPKKHWRALGTNIAGIVGLTHMTGFPDDPPTQAGVVYPDFAANPFHASLAILCAIDHAHRTGKGVVIDLGQYESTAVLVGPHILAEAASGNPSWRMGNAHPWMVPHGVYPTSGFDRWIAITVATDQQWRGLFTVLDLPNLQEWATFVSRRKDIEALNREIGSRTQAFDGYKLMQELQEGGVPAGVVQTLDNVVERDTYLSSRFMKTAFKDGIEYRVPGPAFHQAGWDPPVGLLSDLGLDTDRVLQELGGYSQDEIEALYASKSIENWGRRAQGGGQ